MSLISGVVASSPVVTVVDNQCIPANDVLGGAITPVIDMFSGAVGGIIPDIVTLAVIVLLGLVIAFVLTQRASGFMRAIVTVLAAVPVVIILLIVFNAIITGLNGLC